jgi:hypothetical protein
MSQALPVGGFRWLEKEEFEHLNINSVSMGSDGLKKKNLDI